MGMEVFPAERTKKCQAPIKLARPFPAPELRAENYGHEDCSETSVGGREGSNTPPECCHPHSHSFAVSLVSLCCMGLGQVRGAPDRTVQTQATQASLQAADDKSCFNVKR